MRIGRVTGQYGCSAALPSSPGTVRPGSSLQEVRAAGRVGWRASGGEGADRSAVLSPDPGLRCGARGSNFIFMRLLEHFRLLRDERRRLGWKGLLKQRGWKFVALVVVVYLVRDVVLYVLVPLAIAAGLWR